ncbi:hypothetical protein [Buchnera aphidicola]|nr:hypothetical protein [Buchnera aphidicola]
MKKGKFLKQLDVNKIDTVLIKLNSLSDSEFIFLHNQDTVTVEKLSEGI